jgi:dipeptidase
MKKYLALLTIVAALFCGAQAFACTSLIVTKGASTDGSTMITYSADAHTLYGELYFSPAADYAQGAMRDVYEADTGKHLGKIPQVRHTYSVVGYMNEHQLAISETTYGGREELHNKEGKLDYGSLMWIALERAKTAREAIAVMAELVEAHGYCSEGETFSIADTSEVWMMDMIGRGPKEKGAVWVALRVPDGYICAHANQSRIRTFPLDDPENCLYARDVISFARKMGYFKGEDKDFSFMDAYAPLNFEGLRMCEARVWQMFRRAAPSLKLGSELVKGEEGKRPEPLPLWVKPDARLSVHDAMELMRDHFEGTEFDLSKGVGAGPYQLPYRWRPLTWKSDKVEYFNERSTSTQQTGFSFVTQSRAWLPSPVGGVMWFGVDDSYSTVYVPMYAGLKEAPKPYAAGTASFREFSWDSAFWVFNFVSNFAYSRYRDMIQDIRTVQAQLEGSFLAAQPEVEKAAVALYNQSPELARDYLTQYSAKLSDITVTRWRKLLTELLMKYLDGNKRDSLGKVTHPGYPEEWYRTIIKESGDYYRKVRLKGEPEPEVEPACKCPHCKCPECVKCKCPKCSH